MNLDYAAHAAMVRAGLEGNDGIAELCERSIIHQVAVSGAVPALNLRLNFGT